MYVIRKSQPMASYHLYITDPENSNTDRRFWAYYFTRDINKAKIFESSQDVFNFIQQRVWKNTDNNKPDARYEAGLELVLVERKGLEEVEVI